MTPEQLSAICNSFDKALSMSPDLGSRFYLQLASDHPETKEIFDSISMEAQHTRFISMLRIILIRMNDGLPVASLLQELGKQHVRFGVKEEDFEKFGTTLMKVLRELLGKEFDGHMCDAWVVVYEEITRIMKSANN